MNQPTAPAPFLSLQHANAMELLTEVPDESVHLIAADLPYGILPLPWDKRLPLEAMWAEFRRIITPTGVIALNAVQPFTTDLINGARDLFKYSIIWERNRPSGFVHAKQRPMKVHEDILLFSKASTIDASRCVSRMTYNPQGIEDDGQRIVKQIKTRTYGNKTACSIGRVYQAKKNYPRSIQRWPNEHKPFHPTQKPLAMLEWIVATYSNPGELVLDPCMGSGTAGVAALKLGRDFIGIEQEGKFFDHAFDRINAELPHALHA